MSEKAVKAQDVIAQVLTEYIGVPVACSKCGDKIRTDLDNKVYCPNNVSDCPLIR